MNFKKVTLCHGAKNSSVWIVSVVSRWCQLLLLIFNFDIVEKQKKEKKGDTFHFLICRLGTFIYV